MDRLTHFWIGVCQFHPCYLQSGDNRDRIVDRIYQAVAEQSETRILVFPECAVTGFPAPPGEDRDVHRFWEASEPVPGPTIELIAQVTVDLGIFVALGLSERQTSAQPRCFNSAVLIGPDGRIWSLHRKCQETGHALHYFDLGNRIEVTPTPLGILGMSVCYDLWFPEFMRAQARQGCEIHLNVTANQPQFGVGSTHLPAVRAAENTLYVASSNQCGDSRRAGGLTFIGQSSIVDPTGCIQAQAGNDEETIFAQVDIPRLHRLRGEFWPLREARYELYGIVDPLLDSEFESDERAKKLDRVRR